MMKKMKLKYISDLVSKIEDLKELVDKKDFKGLESFLHKLKGSGASYGLPEISDYGAKYEQKAKDQALSDEELRNLVPELVELHKRFSSLS